MNYAELDFVLFDKLWFKSSCSNSALMAASASFLIRGINTPSIPVKSLPD
jgi:hypothetical protein